MANLKEIRSRIASVGSTMQITSAMKMVSAANLKIAQDAITHMRPYANKLTELLANLSSTLDVSDGGVYSEKRELKKLKLNKFYYSYFKIFTSLYLSKSLFQSY